MTKMRQGTSLKEALPSSGMVYNSGSWRKFKVTAEVLIVAPHAMEELFFSGTWTEISKRAATLAKRVDIKSALAEARSASIIIP